MLDIALARFRVEFEGTRTAMSVYTVHEPPSWRGSAAADAERFAFVRDGFSLWAFLLAPLWMLRHRMWLVLLGYVVVSIGLDILLRIFGVSRFAVSVIGLLISLWIGLESGTLRRFTLGRRGWRNVGIVSGANREAAERRFFDMWLRRGAPPPLTRAPAARAMHMPASAPPGSASEVLGLFPEAERGQ
jgi:hypothetical protein